MRRISMQIVFALATISLIVANDFEDPLSDKFIEEINQKATTWKVYMMMMF